MPISNPEVEAGDETDGIIGNKKRRVRLKQGVAAVFRRIRSSQSKADCNLKMDYSVKFRLAAKRRGQGKKRVFFHAVAQTSC